MRRRRWFVILAFGFVAVAPVASHAQNEPQPAPSAAKGTPKEIPKEAPKEPVKEPAPPPSVTIIAPREAHGVLGRDVRSPTDEAMGRRENTSRGAGA